jgi:hypothetical protein
MGMTVQPNQRQCLYRRQHSHPDPASKITAHLPSPPCPMSLSNPQSSPLPCRRQCLESSHRSQSPLDPLHRHALELPPQSPRRQVSRVPSHQLQQARACLRRPQHGSVTSWESGAALNYILRVYDTRTLAGVYDIGHTLGPGDEAMEQERVDFEKWEEFWLVSTLSPMAGQVGWYRHHSGKEKCGRAREVCGQVYRCSRVLGE